MDLNLIKSPFGLIANDASTADSLQKIKTGTVVTGKFTVPRNYQFHKKFFSLLNLAYEYWEPAEIDHVYGTPQKTFERFRKDLTIMAGFYNVEVRVNNTVRVVAKSLSFAEMDQEEFEDVYDKVLDVIIRRVMVNFQHDDLTDLLERVVDYA